MPEWRRDCFVRRPTNTVEPGYNDIGLYRRPTNTLQPCYNDIGLYRRPTNTVEPGYNDIGLSDISSITSDVLWYQFIPHC